MDWHNKWPRWDFLRYDRMFKCDFHFHWRLAYFGTAEGLTFKLSFSFPSNYPYSSPTVLFTTPMFHPNVDMAGRICLDILKDKWSAVYNVQSILLSLQSLLGEPNNKSPLNGQAAELWDKNPTEYATLLVGAQYHTICEDSVAITPS